MLHLHLHVWRQRSRDAAGRMVVWSHPAFADRTIFVRNDKEIVAVSFKK